MNEAWYTTAVTLDGGNVQLRKETRPVCCFCWLNSSALSIYISLLSPSLSLFFFLQIKQLSLAYAVAAVGAVDIAVGAVVLDILRNFRYNWSIRTTKRKELGGWVRKEKKAQDK